MTITLANTDSDILKCWAVLKVLRPHLEEQNFLATVKEMQSEGYMLAFIEKNNKAVSAIGFRYLQYLFNGKHIYIDDLSTLPECRGEGHAGKLLDYVFDYAKQKGLKVVALDSGHQRTDAHRLYLNKGFTIAAHHFIKNIL